MWAGELRRGVALAMVGLLLVLGGGLAVRIWAPSYGPPELSAGSTFGVEPPFVYRSPQAAGYSVGNGETMNFQAPYTEGREVRYAFGIRNDGAAAVRVLGLDLTHRSEFPHSLVEEVAAYDEGPGPGFSWTRGSPLRAFDLPPGAERVVLIRGVFANCGLFGPGITSAVATEWVRYAGAGGEGVRQIQLPFGLLTQSPGDCQKRDIERRPSPAPVPALPPLDQWP